MSVLGKKWVIKNTSGKNTIKKILENRGLKDFEKDYELHDPFLFADMERAVERIDKAISNNERIIVFGDYDVDGITGTAILVNILRRLSANVSYRLPNRMEDGYGFSEKFIPDFVEKGVKLLITVDCGISCADTIAQAAGEGIETIVTDHHEIPRSIPKEAVAILHPRDPNSSYPERNLTGAGMAFKLAQALIEKHFPEKKDEYIMSVIDLAALGTVADIGPLKGENRTIVKKGIQVLCNTKWVGLKKIMQLADVKEDSNIDASTIGYRIAPRINAAGRIGDPYLALSLLLAQNFDKKVNMWGNKLEELNSKRKEMMTSSFIEAESGFDTASPPFIFIAHNPDWHVGILGLVAGRLVETYARPAIIMQDFGDTLVASARSPEYFNIVEAITVFGKYLTSFGGHSQAAGFNMKKENLEAFKKEMADYAEEKLKGMDLRPTLKIDCALDPQEASFEFISEMEKLKPYGVENPKPTFLLKGIEPHFVDLVGREQNHLKFSVEFNKKNIGVIAFHMGKFADALRTHKKIDIVCHLERHSWNSRENLQFQALDFRESRQ
ncbi:MAG: single-stranded-DNA-specific exonuclease RecJ [Candidatus Peregrinibacteria bacterium]